MVILRGRLLVGDGELAPFPPEVVVPVALELVAGCRVIFFDKSRLVLDRVRVNVSFVDTVRMSETGEVTGKPLLKYPLLKP